MARSRLPRLALPVLLASTLLSGSAVAQVTRTALRVADHYPANASTANYTIKFFMDTVREASGGAVTFEYYPSEQLGKARDMLALTQQGVTDIGFIAPAYVSDKMPLSGVAELPGTYSGACQAVAGYWKLAKQGILADREFKTNGIRPLFAYLLQPYQILTRRPGIDVAGLRGLKLRSGGAAMDVTVRHLDGTPIRLGGADVYSALSRGTIDGVVFPLAAVREFKLDELLRAGTLGENLGGFASVYAISEKRWNALSEDVRKVLDEAGEQTVLHACTLLEAEEQPAVDRLREAGLVLQPLSPADHAKVLEALRPVQSEWATGLDARGLPGSEVLRAFLAALPQPR